MNILQILETRFNSVLLKELQEGYVDETETKFMAYSIHSLNKDDFEDFYNFYLHNHTGYSTHQKNNTDDEKYRSYNDNGSYSLKDLKQLVAESIIKHIVFTFYGIFYKNDWYIIDEFSCFEENTKEDTQAFFKEMHMSPNALKLNELFKEVPQFRKEIDYKKVEQMIFERTEILLNL
jgi:hypothetical protein